MSEAPRILISAGEASGDRLGAGLARALRSRRPDVELYGMGGERMERAGVRRIQDASEVAVVGIFEVLAHLGAIRRAKGRMETALAESKPDLFVPVDFPDFNLLLAGRARRSGVPVVYFVSPQVWAWRRGRLKKIRKLVRRMLVLFPFEVPFYEEAGVPVTFVGHPAVDEPAAEPDRAALRRRAGLPAEGPVVALMPGSRRSEVDRLLPVMLEAAARLAAGPHRPAFLLPLAENLDRAAVEARLSASGLPRVAIHRGDFPEILGACDVGIVASGTASLEAAVAGLPVVVVYRVGSWTYALARRMVRLDHVALPNLVAGRRVLPELIQDACRPEAIVALLEAWLGDPLRLEALRGELAEIRRRLGEPGIYERAAEAVLAELDRSEVAMRRGVP